VSIEALKRAAALVEQHKLDVEFRQMAGEQLDFGDSAFDGILCMSAFHHMDLDRAASEFARVLRPGGRLVLVEPLASNPPAWIYRRVGKIFSREATSEETPLHVRDLKFLRKHFRKVEWRGMYMMCLVPFGLDRMWNKSNPLVHRVTQKIFDWLSPLDSALLRIPGLRRMAWKIAIIAER
jgi:SAM-dependent methyltransferase